MPDAGVLATILLIVGLFLLALELMIPSFGIIGVVSAICLLVSAWAAWQAWWDDSPGYFWTYAGFWLLGIPSVLGGTLFVLQHTSLGDRLVLRSGEAPTAISNDEQQMMNSLIGQRGIAASTLMPGGMVKLGAERLHAESRGKPIESGCCVEVVDVRGTRLVVRECSNDSVGEPASQDSVAPPALNETLVAQGTGDSSHTGATPDDTPHGTRDDPLDSLDFDIPDN